MKTAALFSVTTYTTSDHMHYAFFVCHEFVPLVSLRESASAVIVVGSWLPKSSNKIH